MTKEKTLKKLFIALAVLLLPCLAQAQVSKSANLTTSGTSTSFTATSGACVDISPNSGGATIQLDGTWSGTMSFYASVLGNPLKAITSVQNSVSASTQAASGTANGIWQFSVSGYSKICGIFTTATSGTVITTVNTGIPTAKAGGGGGSGSLSGMTGGQIPVAATASTVTSSVPLQGTDTSILSSGTVSGVAAALCTDAQGGATTSGCPSGGITNQVAKGIPANTSGTSTALDSTVCTPPATVGTFVVEYQNPTAAATAPVCPQAGVAPRSISGATATDTVGATTPNDALCVPIIHDIAGSQNVAVTLPTPTTLANAAACILYENHSTHTDTITPTTFTIQSNTTAAGATLTIAPGTATRITVDAFNANVWDALTLNSLASGSAFPITITGGVSGAVPCFTSTTVESAGTLLAANGLVLGGGAGVCPTTSANFGVSGGQLNIGAVGTSGVLGLLGTTSGTATLTPPAVAGTATNPVTMSNTLQGPAGAAGTPTFAVDSNSGTFLPTAGTVGVAVAGTERARFVAGGLDMGANAVKFGSAINTDTVGLTLSGTTILAVGNTGAADTTRSVAASGLQSRGTKFSASGCSNASTVGGATAGKFTVTTGACAGVTITMGDSDTASNGWACHVSDITTPANVWNAKTGGSTTTAVVAGTSAGTDTIEFFCMGY